MTWLVIRALIGSVTVGSDATFSIKLVKRFVLRATWCVHTPMVVTRIERHASTSTMPDRIRRRRELRGLMTTACVSFVISRPHPPIARRNATQPYQALRARSSVDPAGPDCLEERSEIAFRLVSIDGRE